MHSISIDTYQLWRRRGTTPRVHEESLPPTPSLHRIRAQSDLEHHFAPPLSAYLADQCGAHDAAAEYNAAVEEARLSGASDVPLLAPATLRRLDALRRIRATGYTTLLPIGVGATMAEMDREADADLLEVQVENLAAGEAEASVSGAGAGLGHLEGGAGLDADLDAGDLGADLDDGVLDADGDTFDSSGGATPDGFMAEDVEYQHDHSLGLDLAYEPVTAELGVTAPTLSTAPTAVSTARRCDDSDVDMTFD